MWDIKTLNCELSWYKKESEGMDVGLNSKSLTQSTPLAAQNTYLFSYLPTLGTDFSINFVFVFVWGELLFGFGFFVVVLLCIVI